MTIMRNMAMRGYVITPWPSSRGVAYICSRVISTQLDDVCGNVLGVYRGICYSARLFVFQMSRVILLKHPDFARQHFSDRPAV